LHPLHKCREYSFLPQIHRGRKVETGHQNAYLHPSPDEKTETKIMGATYFTYIHLLINIQFIRKPRKNPAERGLETS